MPIGPGGERLPYPGDPGYMGNGPDMPPMGPPMGGPGMGGQEQRLNQLLEARQMIDQEIAAIVGGPVGAENLDMLPPPPMDAGSNRNTWSAPWPSGLVNPKRPSVC